MQYWWVNQNQTHKQEIGGGYLWSPKKNKNGASNHFYDNMTHVVSGDIIFSFYQQKISAMGIATSTAYSEAKPEFGNVGVDWNSEGWMVNVDYFTIENKISPKQYISKIVHQLPDKYSPLQKDGSGNQVYLCSISHELASTLVNLIGEEAKNIVAQIEAVLFTSFNDDDFESERIEKLIVQDDEIPDTEKEAIIKARKGQGKFRKDVIDIHKKCVITGVNNPDYLTASHIKPWSKCANNMERLDPYNGLPLTPVADKLFDNGKITFLNDGKLVYKSDLDLAEIKKMGIDLLKPLKINMNEKQNIYMSFHREFVFKE